MTRFNKLQSIALWLHIPMWICAAIVIVLVGAYHTGIKRAEAKEAAASTLVRTLPIMTLHQLTQIRVDEI